MSALYESPMTTEFRRRIEEFTYKPGVRFVVAEEPEINTIVFTIVAVLTDSRSGQGSIPISLTQHLNLHYAASMLEDKRFFAAWVRDQVTKFELHEMDEWLLEKGKFVRNPHPGGPDGPPRTATRSRF